MTSPTPMGTIQLADWIRRTQQSALQEILALISRPNILSFALGLPASEFFPLEAMAQAAAHVLESSAHVLQYQPPSSPLKTQIVALMAERGIRCREEQVFLTAGAQQALSLLVHLLLDPGQCVLTENKLYPGFQQVLKPLGATIVSVPTDPRNGMDVDAVETELRTGPRPACIYAMSDGHNPLGFNLSQAQRIRLVELARQYEVPIIEDDAYGFLTYNGQPVPPMRAIDENWVLYVGSCSKILAPALRVGWLVVPETLIPRLTAIKETQDLDVSTFTQHMIAAYLAAGHLPEHLALLRREYRARRDAMLGALSQNFPDQARWSSPEGGLFVWVELPDTVDTGNLLKISAESEEVAFMPGQAFCIGSALGATGCMRLNFAQNSPARIVEGIERLARVINKS